MRPTHLAAAVLSHHLRKGAGLIKDLFVTLPPDDPCQASDTEASMWIIGTLRHNRTVLVNAWTQPRPLNT